MNVMSWALVVIAALVLSTAVSSPVFAANGSTAQPARKAKPIAIDIRDFAFAPKTLTIAPGTRVVWTNRMPNRPQ